MNQKKITMTGLLLAAAMMLGACSAKVDGGSPIVPAAPANDGFVDSKATIAGPTIEGHWLSACHDLGDGKSFRQFEVAAKAADISRVEHLYSDSKCATMTKQTVNHGRFRFIEKFSDSSYTVEYAFDIGNGGTAYPQEKMFLEKSQLYLSNYVIGESATVLKDEPLLLISGGGTGATPTPSPTPEPALKPAQVASTYAEAKYAFCSNQGYGAMVDFQGVNLATNGSGTARIAYKYCNDKNPLQWSKKNSYFTVTIKDGKPQISFPDSTYQDAITPYSYQNGLSGGQSANSMVAGNSGECFFLKNDGTQNIPFTFSCY